VDWVFSAQAAAEHFKNEWHGAIVAAKRSDIWLGAPKTKTIIANRCSHKSKGA
jgi:hypothetical protein